MKRKQKLPRRTRRAISPKPTDQVEYSANFGNAKINEKNDENSNLSVNNCNESREKGNAFLCEMNEFKESKTLDLSDNYRTENNSLNNVKPTEKKNQELAIKSKNSKETSTFTEAVKKYSTPPHNVLIRNLKKSPEYFAPSDDITDSPAAFVNIRNETEGGKMPVILNVFTLSQIPSSCIHNNNFPVTPPCSPPMQKLEEFIGTPLNSNEIKSSLLPSGLASPTLKKTTTSNVHNVYFPVINQQQNVTSGGHLFPSRVKQFIDKRNYTPTTQLTRFYGDNEGAKIEQSKLDIVSNSKNNAVLFDRWKCMTQPFKNVEVSPITLELHEFTEKPSYNRTQCIGERENGADDSHVFMSPTDFKVLQLKRRLKEQEAALKKLCTNH